MTKQEYFEKLKNVTETKIIVGSLQDEMHNTCALSISDRLAKEVSLEEYMSAFEKVIKCKKEQVRDLSQDMLFYCWFEWQSAELKYNIISNRSLQLPFNGKVKKIFELKPVLLDFLYYPYHNNPPLKDFGIFQSQANLQVYIQPLS